MMKGDIWVYGDLRTPRHWTQSQKVLVKALELARTAEVNVAMVLMGAADIAPTPPERDPFDRVACVALAPAARQAADRGAARVYCLQHARLGVPRADVHANVLADFVKARQPWLVLLPLNDFGREIAAVGAQRCQAGLIADCTELTVRADRFVGRCPAWGGQILADIALAEGWSTAFVTVPAHGEDPSPAREAEHGVIETLVLEHVPAPEGLRLVKRAMEPVEARRLEDARTVVVGGAGMGDMQGFAMVRELAAALGGEVAATRPPVLYHWVEEQRLIGQTGKSVRPKLLISAGASGAIQYTAGIMEAETIVAIDRDPAAPIFQVADIGIVADVKTLLPLLNQRAKQLAMRRLADAACTIGSGEAASRKGFGTLVRQLRQARQWRVEDLAQATGQTPEFIEQVENDRLAPPVSFILGMAQAMQVDPDTFLHKEERSAIRDRRAQAFYQRTQAYSYTTLTPEGANSHLRAFMVTIEAHHDHKPVAYKHEGEEFIFVMEGDLELTLGAKSQVLKPGESIHFNSDTAHKLKSLSSQPTRCLVVLYTV
jgi:electron transfer flavoprotein alpha subunit